MELLLKNVDPKDFALLTDLSKRLGILVETKTEEVVDKPDNASVFDDLKESMAEIRHSRATNTKMQSARELLDEL